MISAFPNLIRPSEPARSATTVPGGGKVNADNPTGAIAEKTVLRQRPQRQLDGTTRSSRQPKEDLPKDAADSAAQSFTVILVSLTAPGSGPSAEAAGQFQIGPHGVKIPLPRAQETASADSTQALPPHKIILVEQSQSREQAMATTALRAPVSGHRWSTPAASPAADQDRAVEVLQHHRLFLNFAGQTTADQTVEANLSGALPQGSTTEVDQLIADLKVGLIPFELRTADPMVGPGNAVSEVDPLVPDLASAAKVSQFAKDSRPASGQSTSDAVASVVFDTPAHQRHDTGVAVKLPGSLRTASAPDSSPAAPARPEQNDPLPVPSEHPSHAAANATAYAGQRSTSQTSAAANSTRSGRPESVSGQRLMKQESQSAGASGRQILSPEEPSAELNAVDRHAAPSRSVSSADFSTDSLDAVLNELQSQADASDQSLTENGLLQVVEDLDQLIETSPVQQTTTEVVQQFHSGVSQSGTGMTFSDVVSGEMRLPLSSQVAQHVQAHLQQQHTTDPSTLTLRLDPPDLGELVIRFSRSDDGVAIRVTAREPVTMDMLLARGQEIEQQLRSNSLDLSSLEFTPFGTDGGQQNSSHQRQQHAEQMRGVQGTGRRAVAVARQADTPRQITPRPDDRHQMSFRA